MIVRPRNATLWVIFGAAALMLAGCNTAGSSGGLERFPFSLPKAERDVVIGCRAGATDAETSRRAQASAAIVDDGLFALGQDIRARVEQASQTGTQFDSGQLRSLSRATGLRLAKTIDEEQGCYLLN